MKMTKTSEVSCGNNAHHAAATAITPSVVRHQGRKAEMKSGEPIRQFSKEEVYAIIEGVEELLTLDWNLVIKKKKELQGRTAEEIASKWKNLFKAIGRQRNSHDPFQREVAKRIDQIRDTLRDQKLWKLRGKRSSEKKQLQQQQQGMQGTQFEIEESETDNEPKYKSISPISSSSSLSSLASVNSNTTTTTNMTSTTTTTTIRDDERIPAFFKIVQTHRIVTPPPMEDPDKIHQWSLRIEPIQKSDRIGSFIESVQYILHPTFQPNSYTETLPPFSTPALLGWGEFEVICIIKLKKRLCSNRSNVIATSHIIDFGKDISETLVSTQQIIHNHHNHSFAPATAPVTSSVSPVAVVPASVQLQVPIIANTTANKNTHKYYQARVPKEAQKPKVGRPTKRKLFTDPSEEKPAKQQKMFKQDNNNNNNPASTNPITVTTAPAPTTVTTVQNDDCPVVINNSSGRGIEELVMGDFSSKLDAFALNNDPLFDLSTTHIDDYDDYGLFADDDMGLSYF